jgi:Bacterial surface proteins containing Ig-like domains
MSKWTKIGAAAIGFTLMLTSVSMAAIIPKRGDVPYENRTGSYSKEEEKEYSRTETTIVKIEDEKKDVTTSTETKDIIEPADIVFVIDSTASMTPYIRNVKANVEKFSEYLEGKGVGARMAVVEYKYIVSNGLNTTKIHTIDGSPWHKTTAELKKTLELIASRVWGGVGANEESLVDALGFVANGDLKFREDAHKFAIVLTDEGFREDNRHGYTTDTLIDALKKENVSTSVITENNLHSFFQKLVDSNKGIFADIQSTNFFEVMKSLADVIFKTIEEEIKNETVTPVESITVTSKGESAIKVGKSITLTAKVLPEDATEKKVSWMLDDDSVVDISVSSDTRTCKVTAKKKGSANIIALTDDGGFTGNFVVKVIGGNESSGSNGIINRGDEDDDDPNDDLAVEVTADDILVSPAKKTIKKGNKFKIKLTVRTEDDSISQEELEEMLKESVDTISYRSANSSIASVNKKTGTVTGKRKGSTTIKTTVVTADGRSKTLKTVVYVQS